MHISGTSGKRALAVSAVFAIALFLGKPSTFAQNTYTLDDGTAEDSVGLTSGGSFISMNSFAVIPGNNTITSISIAWGTPVFPDPTLNGLSYTAVLWSDPNGDGSPTDAVVLATAPGVIALQGTNTFITSIIAPTTVLTPNFFVGYVITHSAGQFPASFDETAPLPNRSFIAQSSDPNNLTGVGAIEVVTGGALVGNWMIRADAIPEPSTYMLTGLGLLALFGARKFARRQKA